MNKLGFAFGHFFNDVCACMWFTYLLVYQQYIMKLNNLSAGYCLMIGQIADGLSTLFIGLEGDTLFKNKYYGQKKLWHLIGTFLTIASFFFIFSPPLPFKLKIYFPQILNSNSAQLTSNDLTYILTKINITEWVKLFYYIPFIIIFQFAWACVQISHLSLIPLLSSDANDRVGLTSIRYAFSVLAYIITYIISWYYLRHSMGPSNETITPDNMFDFQNIAFDIIVIGSIASLIFHILTYEPAQPVNISIGPPRNFTDESQPLIKGSVNKKYDNNAACFNSELSSSETTDPLSDACLEYNSIEILSSKRNISDWLVYSPFYQNLSIYMLSRISANISMAYIPLYLLETQHQNKTHIAIIPLIVYLSGFLMAFCMKRLNIWFGRKSVYALGTFITCISSFLLWSESLRDYIYGIAVGIGAGTSTLIIVSLSLTSDIIGSNTSKSSFVYGTTSLADKVANGLVIYLIQKFYPTSVASLGQYFRIIMTFVPSTSALIALIILFTMPKIHSDHVATT